MINKTKKDDWSAPTSNAAQLAHGLFRTRNHIWNSDQQIAAKHGLTWTQLVTLFSLRAKFPSFSMSPTEIYSAAQVTSGGLAKMLQGLEKDGLIIRVDNPDDRRSRYVQLTKVGKKKVETVIDQLVEYNTELFNGILSEKESAQLIKLLRKLSDGLDKTTSM